MNANLWGDTDVIQQLIRQRVPVDPRQLADPDTPLHTFASTPESTTA